MLLLITKDGYVQTAFAELERALIRERKSEGIVLAKQGFEDGGTFSPVNGQFFLSIAMGQIEFSTELLSMGKYHCSDITHQA